VVYEFFNQEQKMKWIQVVWVLMAGVLCSPAWAVNKCTMPDGKVAFQDAPCAGGRGVMFLIADGQGKTLSTI